MSIIALPEESLSLTWLLDIGIVLGALGVVFLRKIIYSALLLGLVFVCVALWYLLLNADFLAAAQVLIYVGADNVLIVFAIMLVNKPESDWCSYFNRFTTSVRIIIHFITPSSSWSYYYCS